MSVAGSCALMVLIANVLMGLHGVWLAQIKVRDSRVLLIADVLSGWCTYDWCKHETASWLPNRYY